MAKAVVVNRCSKKVQKIAPPIMLRCGNNPRLGCGDWRAFSRCTGLAGPFRAMTPAPPHRNLRKSQGFAHAVATHMRQIRISIQIMGLADLTATVPKLQQICFGNCFRKAFSLRRKSALG